MSDNDQTQLVKDLLALKDAITLLAAVGCGDNQPARDAVLVAIGHCQHAADLIRGQAWEEAK